MCYRFQNGINAPHMLGNQLNPASTMAQKMSDTLNQELEAHSIFTNDSNQNNSNLIGPQLHSRVIASVSIELFIYVFIYYLRVQLGFLTKFACRVHILDTG